MANNTFLLSAYTSEIFTRHKGDLTIDLNVRDGVGHWKTYKRLAGEEGSFMSPSLTLIFIIYSRVLNI